MNQMRGPKSASPKSPPRTLAWCHLLGPKKDFGQDRNHVKPWYTSDRKQLDRKPFLGRNLQLLSLWDTSRWFNLNYQVTAYIFTSYLKWKIKPFLHFIHSKRKQYNHSQIQNSFFSQNYRLTTSKRTSSSK